MRPSSTPCTATKPPTRTARLPSRQRRVRCAPRSVGRPGSSSRPLSRSCSIRYQIPQSTSTTFLRSRGRPTPRWNVRAKMLCMPVNRTPTVNPVKTPTNPKVSKPTLPTELQFRPAAESDWPAIWPLWHEIVAAGDTYCYNPATDSDTARQMWLPSGNDETWVVSVSDEVLGSYHLSPNQAGPGAHVANASYMVSSQARGHGVGRAMVEHSITRASELSY